MIDIIVVDPSERCLQSIANQINPPKYRIHIIADKNPIYLGPLYNAALFDCDYPIFTILDKNDYYQPNALRLLADYIPHKSFGIIHADSTHQGNNKLSPISQLPLTQDNLYGINPVRAPVFYNRQIVEYLGFFDYNTLLPEYDLILKIWEKFPIIHLPQSLLHIKSKAKTNIPLSEIDCLIFASKYRGQKLFYHTGPNLYPEGLLDPIKL